MSDFKIIYKLLKALRDAMDCEQFDMQRVAPEVLGVSKERLEALLLLLANEGYITGLKTVQFDGMMHPKVMLSMSRPQITLKGLEYLEENSLMNKAAALLRGVVDVVK